jgi:hypothetical protein
VKTYIAAVALVIAILLVPASQPCRSQEPTNSQRADELGSETKTPQANQTEKENDCTIIFFREGHYNGAALKPSIFLDGKEQDRLASGRWFSVHTGPGKHELQSSAKNEPSTVIEMKAGETIYVQMVIVNGTWRGAGRLMQVTASDAKEVIAKLKPLHE